MSSSDRPASSGRPGPGEITRRSGARADASAGEASSYARRNDPVDLAERILQLLDDEPTRRRMGRIGRERVLSALSWEHEAPRLLAAYQALFAAER